MRWKSTGMSDAASNATPSRDRCTTHCRCTVCLSVCFIRQWNGEELVYVGVERREIETKRRVVTINYSRVRSKVVTRGRSGHCLALVFHFYLICVFSYSLTNLCFNWFRFGLLWCTSVLTTSLWQAGTLWLFLWWWSSNWEQPIPCPLIGSICPC